MIEGLAVSTNLFMILRSRHPRLVIYRVRNLYGPSLQLLWKPKAISCYEINYRGTLFHRIRMAKSVERQLQGHNTVPPIRIPLTQRASLL